MTVLLEIFGIDICTEYQAEKKNQRIILLSDVLRAVYARET
jgi:hypothetical protein